LDARDRGCACPFHGIDLSLVDAPDPALAVRGIVGNVVRGAVDAVELDDAVPVNVDGRAVAVAD